MEEQKFIKFSVNFSVIEEKLNQIDVSVEESLNTVRQALGENTMMALYPTFYFTINGGKLNEWVPIQTLNIEPDAELELMLDQFNERTSKLHFQQVRNYINGKMIYPSQKIKTDGLNLAKTNYEGISNAFEKTLTSPILFNSKLEEKKKELSQLKCLNQLTTSNFNPIQQNRQLKGDLYYIDLKTQENNFYCVTSCIYGYYINRSTQTKFDGTPLNDKTYLTLIELLESISPQFKETFQQVQELISFEMTLEAQPSVLQYKKSFIGETDKGIFNEMKKNDIYSQRPYRDWNEEMQIVKDMPQTDFWKKVHKQTSQFKIHSEFITASIEGAKNVLLNCIQALNPMDEKYQQVFIHNQIFFSFAKEYSTDFRQETGLDACPTVSTTNCDLRNLSFLSRLNIPELYQLNTCLIELYGYRIIAQSVIPGILNSEQINSNQYGSIDEGKTIKYNMEFHELMKKVCDYFHLKENLKFKDQEEQEFTIAGNVEIKGIRGTDRRNYILDLMRLSPRDLNYPEQENSCCVLRNELVQTYYHILEKKVRYNSSIQTNIEDIEKKEDEGVQLKQMSEFLVENQIPIMLHEFYKLDENYYSDHFNINELFHKYGINMRYLGRVIKDVNQKTIPHLFFELQKQIIVKCLKHVLRQIMRDAKLINVTQEIAHIFNCVFACESDRNIIEQRKLASQKESSNPKKKKKNKKKNILQDTIQQDITTNSKLPSQYWEQVQEISSKRYYYNMPNLQDIKIMGFKFNKLSTLRQLCNVLGIVIETREYNIDQPMTENIYSNLPFQADNILEINPIIKTIAISSDEIISMIFKGNQYILQDMLNQAFELFQSSIQLLINIYGHLHRDIAYCYGKLALIQFRKKQYETAISVQKQSLYVYESLYGRDNIFVGKGLEFLAQYYSEVDIKQSIQYQIQAIFIYTLVEGEHSQLAFAGRVSQCLSHKEERNFTECLTILEELQRDTIKLFGEESVRLSQITQIFVEIYLQRKEFKKAIDYQVKHVQILKAFLKPEDKQVVNGELAIKQLKLTLENNSKSITQGKNEVQIKQTQNNGGEFYIQEGNLGRIRRSRHKNKTRQKKTNQMQKNRGRGIIICRN